MSREIAQERILKYRVGEHDHVLKVWQKETGNVEISLQYLGVKTETKTILLEEDQWCALSEMLQELTP